MVDRDVVIVGAGLGAVRVAEQLRTRGHAGRITVIGAEVHFPYDRPPLSKQVLRGERDSTAFDGTDGLGVEWALGSPAVSLDPNGRKVFTADDRVHSYDALVLATGGRAKTIPGLDIGAGVHVLRTIDDALALREAVQAKKHVIVIGGGFIGCEIASNARALGCDVDLVEALSAPLIRVLGPVAANRVRNLHEANGVRLHLGVTMQDVRRDADGHVSGVVLSDGTVIDGHDIVVGIGIAPDVEWLSGSGIELGDGIVCDGTGRTNIPDAYALGDVAQWWHPLADGHRRVEHWTTTADQASVVAASIVCADGEKSPELVDAPYFWSDQYDIKIQGIGFIDPADQVDELTIRDRTVLLYSRDGLVRGVVGFSIPGAVMRMRAMIQRGAPVREAVDLLTG